MIWKSCDAWVVCSMCRRTRQPTGRSWGYTALMRWCQSATAQIRSRSDTVCWSTRTSGQWSERGSWRKRWLRQDWAGGVSGARRRGRNWACAVESRATRAPISTVCSGTPSSQMTPATSLSAGTPGGNVRDEHTDTTSRREPLSKKLKYCDKTIRDNWLPHTLLRITVIGAILRCKVIQILKLQDIE